MTGLQGVSKSITWMVDAGEVANTIAAAHVFADYASRRPQNTMDAQRTDVRAFVAYLDAVGVDGQVDGLMNDPEAWAGITWGLVAGFVKWMLAQGYAVATINHALSTIKLYVGLAKQAGAVDMDTYLRIKDVKGYSGRDAKTIDEGRTTTRRSNNTINRRCNKKAQHTSISDEQATLLKAQPDTPQGRRDRLMMCLLLDHGLRAGELAGLLVSNIDLVNGVMSFDRPKVDLEQNHKLSADTLRALHAWMGDCSEGFLLRGSRKGGKLDGNGMGEIAITVRVKELGERIGLHGLSAHDCRHYWATKWAGKVDVFRLQEAGGWASLSMPRRYVERAKIANEGMV
jgi:integrase